MCVKSILQIMKERLSFCRREKHPFVDKQSLIAERKRVGEQGPGDRSKEAA
jgi:hypothetical protein